MTGTNDGQNDTPPNPKTKRTTGRRRTHNSNTGRFERDIDTVRRDAQCADMRAQRMTYQQIADELGISRSSAYEAVQRAFADTLTEPAGAARQMELDDLDLAQRAVRAVLEREHVTVSQGRVVRRHAGFERDTNGNVVMDGDGQPVPIFEDVPDDAPILAAVDRLVRIGESRRKLLGLDAPKQIDLSGGITYNVRGVDDADI